MKFANRIRVEFEQPSHGWLPTKVVMNDFELEMAASNVPVNPIYLLYTAIMDVVNGSEATVWWHLEPAGYYFKFTRPEPQLYWLIISFATDHQQAPTFIYEIKGSAADIILPFCRAIKKLASFKHDEHDWPKLEKKQLVRLTELISALKNVA